MSSIFHATWLGRTTIEFPIELLVYYTGANSSASSGLGKFACGGTRGRGISWGVHLIGMFIGIEFMGMLLVGMRLIGMHLMGMHLVGGHLTGMYLIPCTGQHLVQPRRSLDGKEPYPGT